MLRILLFVLFTAVVISAEKYPQNVNQEITTPEQLQAAAREFLQCSKAPAAAVAVISYDSQSANPLLRQLNFKTANGKKNVSSGVDASTNDIFCIASMTKHISATLLVHLLRKAREEKNLNLSYQTLLAELDPSLDFEGSKLRDVTLEDLMTHRTGISVDGGPSFAGVPDAHDSAKQAQRIARLERVSANRDKWAYNNGVYYLVGYAAELVWQRMHGKRKDWKEILREEFFGPLGISDQIEFEGSGDETRYVKGYLHVEGELKQIGPAKNIFTEGSLIGPAGAICMTTEAMGVWMKFLVDGGRVGDKQIMHADDLNDMWRLHQSFPPNVELGVRGYGLGWNVGEYKGVPYIFHNGNLEPFTGMISIFPSKKLSIYTVTSAPGGAPVTLFHHRLFDQLMGNTPVEPFSCTDVAALVAMRPTRPAVVKLQKPDEFEGTFENEIHGKATIKRDEHGELKWEMGSFGRGKVQCYNETETKCRIEMEGFGGMLLNADGMIPPGDIYWPAINFWKNPGKKAHAVSYPWFSNDFLVEFQRSSACRLLNSISLFLLAVVYTTWLNLF